MATKRNGSPTRTGIIVGVIAASCVAAAAFAGSEGVIQIPGVGPRAELNRASTAPIFQPPPGAPLSFADIFERVSPAVVSIIVKADIPVQRQQVPNIPGLPPGFQLFPGQPDDNGPDTREAQAEGSGFFISADGYIVTNNHVVANSKEITVTMTDKRELKATVVGRDQSTDLAVIKVEGRNFPFVNFENSAVPRVGDWVISIGNPFGLGGTATAGIVSAYNRNLPDDDEPASRFVDYLQIDSAINRGNSGGPTFDVYGRVIGVNSAIYSPGPTGGSVGIGFAIPANIAENVAKQLIEKGSITRGYLGAGVQPYTKEMAEAIGRDFPDGAGGAFVSEVVDGGPAQRGGLREGDIIVSLNGQKIADATALTRATAASKPGDTLRLEVLREGKTVNLTVRSGTRPGEDEINDPNADRSGGDGARGGNRGGGRGRGAAPAPEERPAGPTVMGVEMGTIDSAARRQYSIPSDLDGVLVVDVDQSSQFASNLQPGDVITRAGDRAVTKPADVQAVITAQKAAGRKTVLLFINRKGDDGQRHLISGILSIEDEAAPAPARGGGRGGRGGRGGGGRGGGGQ